MKCVKTDDNGCGCYVARPEKLSEIAYIYIPSGKREDIPPSIYCMVNAEIIGDSDVLFAKEPHKLSQVVKKRYNALLGKQNILLIKGDGSVAFEIPQSYAFLLEKEKSIEALISRSDSDLMYNLVHYTITKDLIFMRGLAGFDFDPSAFKLCQRFLDNPDDSGVKQKLEEAAKRKCFSNYILDEDANSTESFKLRLKNILDTERQEKNVIFLHLESISNLIFNSNVRIMPELTKIFDKSVRFSRYYSSATSTLMAVSAIFHGNDFETDRFTGYDYIDMESCHSENIFKTLRDSGYETKPFVYTHPNLSKEFFDSRVYDDGISRDGRFFEYNNFLSNIDDFFEANKDGNFAAFIDYELTHCGVNDSESSEIPIFEQKSKAAYIALNNVVRHVWDSLQSKGLLDKTILVLYGDHGDDKWTRCINNGFSHMTEPYLSSIHTPLAIYDARLPGGYIDSIVSSVDIKPTVLYMLGKSSADSFAYKGINIFESENEYVFSSSLFMNQNENEEIGSPEMAKLNNFCFTETKNKSVCAINDSYCLIAGRYGLQLFNTASDPLSYNNILNFYEFDSKGGPVAFQNFGAWRGHFRLEIMADSQIYDALKNFYRLREALRERISIKMKYVKDIENPFDFQAFNKVRERGFRF